MLEVLPLSLLLYTQYNVSPSKAVLMLSSIIKLHLSERRDSILSCKHLSSLDSEEELFSFDEEDFEEEPDEDLDEEDFFSVFFFFEEDVDLDFLAEPPVAARLLLLFSDEELEFFLPA